MQPTNTYSDNGLPPLNPSFLEEELKRLREEQKPFEPIPLYQEIPIPRVPPSENN